MSDEEKISQLYEKFSQLFMCFCFSLLLAAGITFFAWDWVNIAVATVGFCAGDYTYTRWKARKA